jgi:hypothetical protein
MNPCVASKMLEAVHPEEMCEIPGVAGIAYTGEYSFFTLSQIATDCDAKPVLIPCVQ